MSAITSSWISTAVSYNVQELFLSGFGRDCSIPLPLPLFSCKLLVVLKLEGKFVINVPEYVSLLSLKTLCLWNVVFCDDHSVKRLLSGSPILEDFIVMSCDMEKIEVFDVSSPSLKRFEIHNCDGDYELSVKSPNLKRLNFNSYALRGCSGEAFKSPLEACIVLSENWDVDVYHGKIHEFVDKACNAQKLMLHRDVMQGVVRTQYPWPNFHALTYLDLYAKHNEGWESLPGLLESSPFLETLILWGFRNGDGQFPLSCVPKCFSMHLKTIQLNLFDAGDEEFTMVEYILANAKVLEKLIICPNPDAYEFDLDWSREKVLAFQTYSQACQIVTAWEYKEEIQISSHYSLSI